ncbi:MAG: amino acid adenylation domain-containing protein [Pseudomonas sp.]|uniref:non-ribosomal peptide synthetase n=1 Tax=Pseudomonas sp. TaxID=306 RepID=UPI00339715C1
MTAHELLELFRQHAVGLEVDGDKLRCKAPRGFMNAERLDALKRHKVELIGLLGSTDAITPRAPGALLPLSFSQRQLWFLDQLEPGNPFYNIPTALWLDGPLDVDALTWALNALRERHEILRTTFATVDGEPRQVVHPSLQTALPLTDLSALPAAERERQAQAAAQADAARPFDLARGPLIRSVLLRLGESRHLWLLNLHHIVADGWSMAILLQELASLYGAFLEGRPSPLPALPIQYGDYACWQQQRLQGSALQAPLAYWREYLRDAPALLDLPTDRPRPPVQGYRGATWVTGVDAASLGELRGLARQTQGTLYNLLLAALAVLLGRYSGQRDVCIGSPFANRTRQELEGLIGHFVNTQVIRTRLDPQQSFAELLREVRGQVLQLHAYQEVPFDRVVEAVNPPRQTSHSPLFQVMLVLQNTPGGALQWPGLNLSALVASGAVAKFDLTLEAVERDGQLQLSFEYNTDLFDATSVERLAAHYVRLLAEVGRDPKRPLGQLSLLDEAQQQRQLLEWNRSERPFARQVCLHQLIEAQVRRAPDAVALSQAGQGLSYAALNSQANRLAHHLRALGVGPDVRVALCLERSPELLIGLLAVLKAGGAYVPLDPEYPLQRLRHMLLDSAPRVLLTHGAARAAVAAALDAARWPVTLLDLEQDASRWAHAATDDLAPAAIGLTPAHLAYVLYTSGSTGVPKGVMVEHRALVNLVQWTSELCPLGDQGRVLQKTPCSFDASVWEFFWPLASGAELVLARPDGHRDPGYLIQEIRARDIRVIQFVPVMLQLFLQHDEVLQCRSLTEVFCGGGELTPALVRLFRERLPWARLHNVYGPTEATVDSTVWTLEPGAPVPAAVIPIGRPIANARVYLLDDQDLPVPIGVTGHLHIGGAGVARGYLNLPALSAERFIDSPFVADDRLYRSGDLARQRTDGNLEFLGRNDLQVKIRGFRLELGEIESNLLQCPGVLQATVLVLGDTPELQRLVACCVAAADIALDSSALAAFLATRLPDPMLPRHYLWVAALPLLPNGKLDRAALLRLAEQELALKQVNLSSPRDGIELRLYQIWKDLLLAPQIGIRDSFFDLGGSSISAIKMAHQVAQAFAIEVPVRVVIGHPSIEALGGWIRAGANPEAAQSNLIEFRPGSGAQRVVCIHPAGGTAFCYLSLAKVLPEDIGVYGVQSPGLNPGEATEPSVEAMAEAYLRLIEPLLDGPLILTGLSFGGLVAYEMARRLALAGQPQVSLVLLDTQGSDDPQYRAQMAPVDMAEFRAKLVKFNGMYPGIDDAQVERYFTLYNHNRLCVATYACPPAAGRIVLVQAQEGRPRAALHELRRFWRRRAAGGYRVKLVRGDHWDMLETAEVLRVGKTIQQELLRFSAPIVRQALYPVSQEA